MHLITTLAAPSSQFFIYVTHSYIPQLTIRLHKLQTLVHYDRYTTIGELLVL